MPATPHKAMLGLLAIAVVALFFATLHSTKPQRHGGLILETFSKKESKPLDYFDAFETTSINEFVDSSTPSVELLPVDESDTKNRPSNFTPRTNSAKMIKIIYQPTGRFPQTEGFNKYFDEKLHFEGCEQSNCKFTHSRHLGDTANADIVLMEFQAGMAKLHKQYSNGKKRLLWFVWSREPPGLHNWPQDFNKFDGYMAYRTDATVYWPWGETKLLNKPKNNSNSFIDYARNRTKGAFAYVSHCKSVRYDRLGTMQELSKYINVDIYGGCTRKVPCQRFNFTCETKLHSQYRFFLSFENSLCKDYITEKFWKRLASDGHFVPVVVGGKSIEDYSNVAPPNSFIHAYNFSSIQKLGEYLQHLMSDDVAYNRYHEWRQEYAIAANTIPLESACKLCGIANNPDKFLSQGHRELSKNWNDPAHCRELY